MIATFPHDRLYWLHLPAGVADRSSEARGYRLEAVVPQPLESLHWVEARVEGGGWLIAAIDRDGFRAWLEAHPDHEVLLEVHPDGVPAHVGIPAERATRLCQALELLQGDFEPQAVRAQRHRYVREIRIAVAVAAACLLAAMVHRGMAWRTRAIEVEERRAAVLAEVVRDEPGSAGPEAKLLMVSRRLDQQKLTGQARMQPEAWEVLEAALATGPWEAGLIVEQIDVDRGRFQVRGVGADLAMCQRWADRLTAARLRGRTGNVHPMQVHQQGDRQVCIITIDWEGG